MQIMVKNFNKNLSKYLYLIVRIFFGLMWLDAVKWKIQSLPDFGISNNTGLYFWVTRAVEYPVFTPFAAFVQILVLPNLFYFGYLIILIELVLGIGYIVGKKIQLLGILATIQIIFIILSIANTPHEWIWTYILMILVSLSLTNIYILKRSSQK